MPREPKFSICAAPKEEHSYESVTGETRDFVGRGGAHRGGCCRVVVRPVAGGNVFAAPPPQQEGQTPVASLSAAATQVNEYSGEQTYTVTLDPPPSAAVLVAWQVGPDSDQNTADARLN